MLVQHVYCVVDAAWQRSKSAKATAAMRRTVMLPLRERRVRAKTTHRLSRERVRTTMVVPGHGGDSIVWTILAVKIRSQP